MEDFIHTSYFIADNTCHFNLYICKNYDIKWLYIPYWNYVAGTIISELALGSIGFFLAAITHSTVIGYLISTGYFLLNFLGNISSQSIFYLFSMGTENYITKLWLMGISILFLSVTFIHSRKVH